MTTRIKYSVPADVVLTYARENLKRTNALSDAILNFLESQKNEYYTLLPEGRNENEVSSLSRGGIGSGERDHVESFIRQQLSKNSSLHVILDNASLTYTPNYSDDAFDLVGLSYKDEGYYHLTQKTIDTHDGLLNKCLYYSDAIWHSLCVLYDSSEVEINDKELSAENFKRISHATQCILMRAYDQEGYIIWERH